MTDYPAQFLSLIERRPGPYFFWRSPEGEILMAAGSRRNHGVIPSGEWRSRIIDDLGADPEHPSIALLHFSPTDTASSEWEGFPPVHVYEPEVAMHLRGGEPRFWGMDASALAGSDAGRDAESAGEGTLEIRAWDQEQYRGRVEAALHPLREGVLEKVVIARRSTIRLSRSFDLYRALHAMQQQPHAFSICWSPDGRRFFLSATPERLGRVSDGHFETMALAGTVTRRDGRSVETLLSDAKEQAEHHFVVEMLRSAAATFSSAAAVREVRVLELPHVTHILTHIGGRMKAECGMRHVIAALHPTPAVAGTPRGAAEELIAALEPFDRGMYAGCAGWFIGDREGDAAVTIRSTLVSGCDALVWAGAGIVAESDAAAEERETRAKLQTMIDILASAC